jgi:hypothetical protein
MPASRFDAVDYALPGTGTRHRQADGNSRSSRYGDDHTFCSDTHGADESAQLEARSIRLEEREDHWRGTV